MEKQFVPFEIAIELKELGFEQPCFSIYKTTGELIFTEFFKYNKLEKFNEKSYFGSDYNSLKCYAPLYRQAFEFFREKYDLVHSITPEGSIENRCYLYTIKDYKAFVGTYGQTYNQAEINCLEKLIEIVKYINTIETNSKL